MFCTVPSVVHVSGHGKGSEASHQPYEGRSSLVSSTANQLYEQHEHKRYEHKSIQLHLGPADLVFAS